MNAEWRSFLAQQGAVLEGEHVLRFGDIASESAAAATANVLVDLSDLSLIRVRGPDATAFLQGQLSNDILQVGPSRTQLSSYSSPKGRMLAVFRVFLRDGHHYLQLPSPLRESVMKRLRMFVLRAKVMLESADEELVAFGVSGPDAGALVARYAGAAPLDPGDCETRDRLTIMRLPGIHPRFAIVAPPAEAKTLWEGLRNDCTPVGPWVWRWLDIMAGVPTVLPQTSEAFVPQMANLELLGGVNFKKGCYPGQEIVARTHYLGRLKQRMYRARVDAASAPQPGDALYAADFGEQSAGTVVDAQPSPEGGYDLLAVIQITSAETGNVHLWRIDGPAVGIRPLPYPLVTNPLREQR